jgi:serine/threonine-protein kinase
VNGNNTLASQNLTTSNGGQVQAPPVTNSAGPATGKAIAPIRPGQYPDFVGADLVSSLAVLRDNDMNYVIIQVNSDSVPAGLVISQSPAAGGSASDGSAITLVVSRGPTTTAKAP